MLLVRDTVQDPDISFDRDYIRILDCLFCFSSFEFKSLIHDTISVLTQRFLFVVYVYLPCFPKDIL